MPELPEVETVRRDLEKALLGADVGAVTVTGLRSTRRHPSPQTFIDALVGRRLHRFRRHGKYLLVDLVRPGGSADAVLVAHLRMSGQLRLADDHRMPLAPHSHVVITFVDGRQLRFVDPRTFGELFVTSPDVPELAALGPDALDPALDEAGFARLIGRRRGAVKALLLDQHLIAGIGNIYSDEILWASRVRGLRRADSLRPVELRRLRAETVRILDEAVSRRGSSLRDQQYVDLAGGAGGYQAHHAVYAREGLACPRCGSPVRRSVVAQRSHFWCRRCQR